MAIGEAFDAAVSYYDDWMRIALPGYDDLFGTATTLIPALAGDPVDVLDLGAGTGLFSWHVLRRFPRSRLVLVDLAGKLLDVARRRFAGLPVEVRLADYRALALEPGRRFDAVISSLSIHHLEDAEKAALFGRAFGLVRPGGVFVNVDQIKAGSPAVGERYWSDWLARVRAAGAPEDQIAESIDRRRTYDRDASLEDQLRWLREAGVADVDCVYKNGFVGVFFAGKAG